MDALKKKIINEGQVIMPNILKVDHFINHQIDVALLVEMGEYFKNFFKDKTITKILTVEAGGIAIASLAALAFDNIPVVFAKKDNSKILCDDCYLTQVHSFTKDKTYTIRVDKRFIQKEDCVLIIDDFLANGQACLGLIDLVRQASASIAGVGVVIEKGFQPGRGLIEKQQVEVCALATIEAFVDGKVILK